MGRTTASKSQTTNPAGLLSAKSDTPFFQPKLAINQPGDAFEQEADSMAEKVMRKPATETETSFFQPKPTVIIPVQRKCAACEDEDKLQRKEEEDESIQLKEKKEFDIQRKCTECEKEEKIHRKENRANADGEIIQRLVDCSMFTKKEEEIDAEDAQASGITESDSGEPVQRKCENCGQKIGETQATDSFTSQLHSSKGGGSELPIQTKSFFENRFDADFSSVRIHHDAGAASMSSDINAHAFTHGQDIYFNSGQYNTSNDQGNKLLAHELTHVVQQSGDKVQRKKQTITQNNIPDIQRSFYFQFDIQRKCIQSRAVVSV